MRPTKYSIFVILCSCLTTVSLFIPTDFNIIHQTNDTITVQCLLYAPPGLRFTKEVPFLQIRGTLPFLFTKIRIILSDHYRGFQFPNEERVQLWGIFLIRNVTNYDSDVSQRNFVCYQEIFGKNMSVGYSLRTSIEDTNHTDTSNHCFYAIFSNDNCYWFGILTVILTPLSGFIGFLAKTYWKRICRFCVKRFRRPKSLVTTSPTPVTKPHDDCAIGIELDDSNEHFAPRVGIQSKLNTQPEGPVTSEDPILTTQTQLMCPVPEESHEHGEANPKLSQLKPSV